MTLPIIPKPIINGLLFQLLWWACVGLQGNVALAVTVIFAVIHYRFFLRPNELGLIAIVALSGVAIDNILQFIGVFSTGSSLLPLWLWCLWLGFAATLNHALCWFHSKPMLCVVFGFFGGGSSYFGAIRLGAAQTDLSLLQVGLIFGCVWAVLFPIYVLLSMKMVATAESEELN